jgi:hypothetical protein
MTGERKTMMQQYPNTSDDELFWMLVICAVVAGFVCVLAAGTLTTLLPLKTGESIAGGICNTSVRCVTVPKRQKKIPNELRETGSSPKLMASLNPSAPFQSSKSLSQNQPRQLGISARMEGSELARSSV